MAVPLPEHREEILRRWLEFRIGYAELGYRRASYEYFRLWLDTVAPELPSMTSDQLRRSIHAYRKRQRKEI